MKDLDFIRRVVKEWPEGEYTVRLDGNGEICFNGHGPYRDFYPENIEAAKLAFVPKEEGSSIGTRYTREQWVQPAADPVIEALKAGLTPEQYNALKSSRDGLQLQADAGRAGFVAGFRASGEGWNGEHGAEDDDVNSSADKHAARVKAGEV